MFYARCILISLAAATSVALAQQPAPQETVVKFTVEPMPAPVPALKYQLLPELKEMNPGNPIQGYLRSTGEARHFYYSKEASEEREKWLTVPLNDLPLKELRGYGGATLKHADYAARLDNPDWQILLLAKKEGPVLLLPDIQIMREIASALRVRFRVEIADRKYDDAVVTLKTMFALSRHMDEHPTFIGNLVGTFIAKLGLESIEEMIQQPNAPNLYWAMIALPDPLISFRRGVQGQRLLMNAVFAGLDDASPMSDVQIQKVVSQTSESFSQLSSFTKSKKKEPSSWQSWFKERSSDDEHMRGVKIRLSKAGFSNDKLKNFPAMQLLLLDEKYRYDVQQDEAMKWFGLPFWQAEAGWISASPSKDELFALPEWAGFFAVRKSQVRLDQPLAMLRHVEALRLYAAENNGKLPESLDKVNVPLPVDPVTGKQFSYKLDGATATLRGTPPKGEENAELWNVRYTVTIKK